MKKWIALFLAFVILLITFTGCHRDDGAGHLIYFEGTDGPVNIDPLLAQSQSEIMIMRNIFEPLLTVDATGHATAGAAASYTVSADGLTYTFTLREDARWSDDKPVTAKDFMFALQRAILPETQAACAGQLTNIAGAPAVAAGKQEGAALGVNAVNDYTLQIRLSAPDDGLLMALTGPAGMPCRADFFEACGGRYGMNKDSIIANGPFRVSRWSNEEPDIFVRLAKNDAYFMKDAVVPAGVHMTFESVNDRMTRLADETIDCAFLPGNLLPAAKDAGFQTLSYDSDSYGLIFNTDNDAPTGNDSLRKALVQAIDTTAAAGYLPGWCEWADSMIVPETYYGSKAYVSGGGKPAFSQTQAMESFEQAVKELKAEKFAALTLYYVENEGLKPVLDYFVQCWQKQFGIYVTPTAVTADRLATCMKNRDFTIALCSMGNAGGNSLTVLEQFSKKTNDMRAGFAGDAFETLLQQARRQGDEQLTAQQKGEQYLLQNCIVMPAFYTKEYYAYSGRLTGLSLDPFTKVLQFSKTGKF